MEFHLKTKQESLERLDPEFVADLYDVDITSRKEAPLDYSVSSTHKSQLSTKFYGKEYTSQKEMCQDIKQVMLDQMGSDFYLAPIVNYLLENPDQAERVSQQHTKILNDMLATRTDLLSK